MKKNLDMKFLKFFCFASIIIVVYSILTYGQTSITSDEAMQSFLARTILEKKSLFPKEWAYGMGDVWVISTHIFILPFLFLKNQILARVLGNVALFLITIFGMYYLDKKIFKKDLYLISIPLFLLFLNGDIAIGSMRIDAMYTIYMLFITLLLSWIILIYKKIISNEANRSLIKYLFYFCSLIFLISITGIRMLAYFTIPLLMSFLLKYYFDIKNKNSFKKIRGITLIFLILFSIILIPSIIGYSTYILIGKTHLINNVISLRFVQNIEEIRSAFIWYIDALFLNFGMNFSVKITSFYGIQNMISIISFCIIILIIPILQLKKIKNETTENKLFFSFAFFHILINFIGIVFLGENQVGREVYTLTTIYLCQLISANYITTYWINKNNINRKVFILFFLVFGSIQVMYSINLSKNWRLKLRQQQYISNELLKHGLSKGYSSYWNAYNNNLYSNYKLKISALAISEDTLEPYKWLNNISWFEENKNIKTFLLLTEEENKMILPKLEIRFGKPIDKFIINKFHVYIFNYDIIKNIGTRDIVKDKRVPLWEMKYKGNVEFKDNSFFIRPGAVIFGPYAKLNRGNYTLVIHGENLDKANLDIFDTYLASKGGIVQKIEKINSSKAILKFNLEENTKDIEFRISNNSTETIKLGYIEIE